MLSVFIFGAVAAVIATDAQKGMVAFREPPVHTQHSHKT
jgi:hypothetical protein